MKKTAWTLVAACAVVLTAAVIVCCRGGRPSELDDIPPDSEQFVMTPDTGNRRSEPKSGEDVQNLVIVRETPLEAGTNRSDRVAMLGPLDDKTALKMANRSLQGTPGSHGRTPAINRTGTATIVRWPVLSAYAQPLFQPGAESLSVWIDDKTWSIIRSRETTLSIEDAFRIAREAATDWDYDRTVPVEADCRSSHVLFTFPKRPTDGMRIGFTQKLPSRWKRERFWGLNRRQTESETRLPFGNIWVEDDDPVAVEYRVHETREAVICAMDI